MKYLLAFLIFASSCSISKVLRGPMPQVRGVVFQSVDSTYNSYRLDCIIYVSKNTERAEIKIVAESGGKNPSEVFVVWILTDAMRAKADRYLGRPLPLEISKNTQYLTFKVTTLRGRKDGYWTKKAYNEQTFLMSKVVEYAED